MNIDLQYFVQSMNSIVAYFSSIEPKNRNMETWTGQRIFTDLSAHISIVNGDEACVVMTMSRSAAERIATAMLGSPVDFESELIGDAVGELLNTIVGTTQRVSGKKYHFSIPVMAKGVDHEVKVLTSGYSQRVLSTIEGNEVGLYLVQRSAKSEQQ